LRVLSEFLRPVAWSIAKAIGERAVYATISEDLPHASNRVREHEGAIVVDYMVDPLLKERAKKMRHTIRKAFAPLNLRFLKLPGVANWGHPMGTCRMGTDPATSVTNAEGRVHGHDRIFVADASAFPSSGGVGPGLTVLALALRVADQVAADSVLVTQVADTAAAAS
jgi:choline dehydrogenase-like flavoprotein